MFEHLDDISLPSPGAEERVAVLHRAAAIRGRRRLVVAVAACVMVAGATSGLVFSRNPSREGASAEVAFQFNMAKEPLPVGAAVPTTALVDIVFTSSGTGYGLASHHGHALLAVTHDGGNTWSVQNDQLPAGYGQSTGYPGQMEFIGDDGLLWGGSTGVNTSPLWVTTNAGRTWRAAPIGPVVDDVSAIGTDVWALVGCGPQTYSDGKPCPVSLETSSNSGISWSLEGATGFADAFGAASLPPQVELARIDPTRAYVLTSSAPYKGGTFFGLLYTDDGGATWVRRSVPCSQTYASGAEVAASSTAEVWLLCGGQASGSTQTKELFRSADGGVTWELSATATGESAGQAQALAQQAAEAQAAEALAAATAQQDAAQARSTQGSAATAPASKGQGVTPAEAQAEEQAEAQAAQAAAEAAAQAARQTAAARINTLPLNGFIAPLSIGHDNFAVTGSLTAWLKPFGASVFETSDGGHSWRAAPDLGGAQFGGSGNGNVTFISATDGWVCSFGVGLWHTSNGVNWVQLGT